MHFFESNFLTFKIFDLKPDFHIFILVLIYIYIYIFSADVIQTSTSNEQFLRFLKRRKWIVCPERVSCFVYRNKNDYYVRGKKVKVIHVTRGFSCSTGFFQETQIPRERI